jgi:hypothetical protein
MGLEACLLLPPQECFQLDYSAVGFTRECHLFHFALAQKRDPMLQAARDERRFDAAGTQQLIHGDELAA